MNEPRVQMLSKAEGLIADVQIEMLKEDDRCDETGKNGDWRELYRIRGELSQFIYRMKLKEVKP